MNSLLITLFVITYAAIAFEHPIKINKSASALLGAGLMWAVYAVMSSDSHAVNEELAETLVWKKLNQLRNRRLN
jgi:Na+/H+ antiporter NhaD/arsenite permease-like protein